jgi:hypothetical protein
MEKFSKAQKKMKVGGREGGGGYSNERRGKRKYYIIRAS